MYSLWRMKFQISNRIICDYEDMAIIISSDSVAWGKPRTVNGLLYVRINNEARDKTRIQNVNFLFLNKNLWCDHSFKSSRRDDLSRMLLHGFG